MISAVWTSYINTITTASAIVLIKSFLADNPFRVSENTVPQCMIYFVLETLGKFTCDLQILLS